MERTAILSPDGLYRYSLGREWNTQRPSVMFVMLNPSKADVFIDDTTITKCIGFAQRWEFGGLIVVNLYAFRATLPSDLWRSPYDPRGPENDKYISLLASKPARVVCAWGNHAYRDRADSVTRLLLQTRSGVFLPNELYCLGKTNSGAPRHPVRLPYNTQLEVYR